jgi:cysteinyl-tRNA synthetase
MEIVQRYTVGFREVMKVFNTLPPSIEPTATGHISEQIEMTKQIIKNGLAYESNGTIYFDVDRFNKDHRYGALSNRNLDDLLNNTRDLDGQEDKKGKLDFALWIKAKPEHLMQWPSPWGWGFPGWHIECSAMSRKYLGEQFDIHGGGMDLIPTHHTNEIAQNIGYCGKTPVNYWIHTNMLTVNGQKMSKSLGNSFLPQELFTGQHPLLEKGYAPMAVKFFMLQTHYSSTLDFSNEALSAAEKGYQRLINAISTLDKLKPSNVSTVSIKTLEQDLFKAMNDDFNTPVLIAHLFDAVRMINSIADGKEKINEADYNDLKSLISSFVYDVLGLLTEEKGTEKHKELLAHLINKQLEARALAKSEKNFALSDKIRDELIAMGVIIKDSKEGTTWELA